MTSFHHEELCNSKCLPSLASFKGVEYFIFLYTSMSRKGIGNYVRKRKKEKKQLSWSDFVPTVASEEVFLSGQVLEMYWSFKSQSLRSPDHSLS